MAAESQRFFCLRIICLAIVCFFAGAVQLQAGEAGACEGASVYIKKDTWRETMLSVRAAFVAEQPREECEGAVKAGIKKQIERDFPMEWDWVLQDADGDIYEWLGGSDAGVIEEMIESVLVELGEAGERFRKKFDRALGTKAPADEGALLDLYVAACQQRRRIRLRTIPDEQRKIVFTKHYNLGGSHYAYTEGQSDAQHERHFEPGTALCLLDTEGSYGKVQTLVDDPNGVIRDPDVSWDGERILFSWKKSDRADDYHLYEMQVESGDIRQLTFGLGFADYEGAYLPNGDIVFNSSRCVQIVDCWWTEVSNLYTCDKDGRYLRRLSFDQVHTNFPSVTEDGRVLYTRWDYNDRGQLYPQPLFQMNPDGTGQTEFYGNNSWFPTTILHARNIPGTEKVLAIATGHHTKQAGKLIIVDPARGRQENSGVQLISPVRRTEAVRVDRYGQEGERFQYPYPLSETTYVVAYSPVENGLFGIYLMDIEGRRELLAVDPNVSCNQPIPLARRMRPHMRSSVVDYRKDYGTFYIQDIYAGPGLAGVPRGTIKRIRVIALEFRAAGIGNNHNRGPAGGALVSTPVSIHSGSWDVKHVLGHAKVHEDGSACFVVPARTPVYFQALDKDGHAVQSMRSWSTLQPGESFSCVGCHEGKNLVPPAAANMTMAMQAGPQSLSPFYGPSKGFSFNTEIQPILDRHCISCHNERPAGANAEGKEPASAGETQKTGAKRAFSLLGMANLDEGAKRMWSDSYLALTRKGRPNRLVNWLNVQSIPPMLGPYHAGASRSELITMLEERHEGVQLTQEEMDKIACWIDLCVPFCGDYAEANAWSEEEIEKYDRYVRKRRKMEGIERRNIAEMVSETSERSAEAAEIFR